MKKLLGLTASLSLIASGSTSVLACGVDDENKTQETEDTKNKWRNQFLSETNRIINNHVVGNSKNLYTSKTNSKTRNYLNYDNLMKVVTDKSGAEQEIQLSATDLSAIKEDIDNLLSISVSLSNKLNNTLFEISDFDFLLTNIEKILSGFSVDNKISISAQSYLPENETEEQFLFTVKFNLSFSFNYIWNNLIEKQYTYPQELKYLVLPTSVIMENVVNVANGLAEYVYNNDVDKFFRFDEEKLKLNLTTSPDIFAGQASNIYSYFANQQTTLKRYIEKALDDITSSLQTSGAMGISYRDIGVSTTKRLYTGSVVNTIVTDGFWDLALFNKKADVTPKEIDDAFENEFATTFAKKNFITNQREEILNTFHVNIDTNSNEEFCEYGELSLKGVTLDAFGMNIELNSLALLWNYNPIETFAQRAARLFANWRENWGVTTSTDRYALFKLSDTTVAGKKFWETDTTYPFWFEQGKNKSTYYPNSFYSGIGIGDFYVFSANGGKNAYAMKSSQGFSVHYSSYYNGDWTSDNVLFKQSWHLLITIGEITVSINFAYNKDYYSNIWLGKGKVIERG